MMTNDGMHPSPVSDLPIQRLTQSYRFDLELASFLTEFQYRDDGIHLTAANDRQLPETAYRAVSPGIEAVFDSDSSIVLVCYDAEGYQMVNPVEKRITTALAGAVTTPSGQWTAMTDGGTTGSLGEGPGPESLGSGHHTMRSHTLRGPLRTRLDRSISMGIVTPHNAQRGALESAVPDKVDVNTVEKFQGGERDIMTVSATVADPEFGRQEDRFILDPRRLLVAISRSRYLSIVVCSSALFEVIPEDPNRLDDGPLWARLFTQVAGPDPTPAWSGPLAEFVSNTPSEHDAVPVRVYRSTDRGP